MGSSTAHGDVMPMHPDEALATSVSCRQLLGVGLCAGGGAVAVHTYGKCESIEAYKQAHWYRHESGDVEDLGGDLHFVAHTHPFCVLLERLQGQEELELSVRLQVCGSRTVNGTWKP
jgi:hypothetical protein